MCRLLAYKGTPILLDELLYKPKNSLINQSINAKELEEPLNGDGFGIGWYTHTISPEPATFVSLNPAWSNRNLRNLAPKIQSDCFLAHVRAASVGEVSEANCHPFQFNELLMAHNGGVENFSTIKRDLRAGLTDTLYNWIKGQTDSEHLFATLVNRVCFENKSITPESVAEGFEYTFNLLKNLMVKHGIHEEAYLNMALTNGRFIVATRYVSDPKEEPLTLYHSEGSRYVVEDGVTRLEAPKDDDEAVLIASEKLTDGDYWTLIPKNHFVIVEEDLNIRIRPIKA
ncbi:MAG: class II glutamine amidotransferase [Cyclobacteriaceae bacterium]|nr:class II glutamine amidotransferase [Cyclobacteriaceae bacterium]